ncbi:MAG: hypothetical protein ACR2OM_11885, partial [Aestuariivirgaceae bacterium]
AMVGLFAVGYQGGRMTVGYIDEPAPDAAKVAQAPAEPVVAEPAIEPAPVAVVKAEPAAAVEPPAELTRNIASNNNAGNTGAAETSAGNTSTDVTNAGGPMIAVQTRDVAVPSDVPVPSDIPAPSNAPAPSDDASALANQAKATAALQTAAVEPPKEAETKPDPSLAHATRLIGEGHSLLTKGDVLGARDLFTKGLKLGLPEAALALGRSYDPEYLAQLPQSNAKADVSIASSMYQEWYRRSVAAGSISEGVQLDRLIQSMNRQ